MSEPDPEPGEMLVSRANEYLQLGGLFNPEMMDHDKVRDLIIDMRDALASRGATPGRTQLTVREQFAMAAMAGSLAENCAIEHSEVFADWCVERADALIAALAK